MYIYKQVAKIISYYLDPIVLEREASQTGQLAETVGGQAGQPVEGEVEVGQADQPEERVLPHLRHLFTGK